MGGLLSIPVRATIAGDLRTAAPSTGGADADVFIFDFGDTSNKESSIDQIVDFRTEDMIDLDIVAGLEQFATESGRTMTELALGWLAAQPTIPTIIAGARNPEQVRLNSRACNCKLTPAQVDAVTRISAPAVALN